MRVSNIKLIFPDYLIIGALVLMLFNHSITTFLIGQQVGTAQGREEINKVIQVLEANPVQAKLLTFHKWRYIIQFFFIPSLYIGSYYYIRRKYWKNQELIAMMAIMVFTSLLINFSNDFGYLLGYFFK